MARTKRRLRPKVECRGCGRTYPRDVYLPGADGSLSTRLCLGCRTKRKERYDWAYALYRWLVLVADKKDVSTNMAPAAIRIIAADQLNMCAVTGAVLTLPAGEFAHGVTIQGWAERSNLTETQRRTLPALMRVTACAKWELGNVVLVTQRVADMFKGFDDLMSAQSFCREFIVREVSAMPPERIYERMMIDDNEPKT